MFVDSMIEKNVFVNDSVIHGRGLFTSIDIPEGSLIMRIKGEIISAEECERRENAENNVYIFWKNDDCYIDTSATDKIKYINHNCKYNCDIEDADDDSLLLIAARDIKAGEELTIDYGYEEIYDYCNCSKCA